MKNFAAKLNSIPTTVKLLIGLTAFYFIGKTLGHR